jgi:hypothetical protein
VWRENEAAVLVKVCGAIGRGEAASTPAVVAVDGAWVGVEVVHEFATLVWGRVTVSRYKDGHCEISGRQPRTRDLKDSTEVFSPRKLDSTGESRVLRLHSLSRTFIERHTKVRGEANLMTPFTPSTLSAAADGGPCPAKGLARRFTQAYKGLKMCTFIQSIAGMPRTGASLERLEPCEGKLSRTVLRGAWAG